MVLQPLHYCSSYNKRRLKNVTAGANPMFYKKGIQKAVDVAVDWDYN